MSSWLRDATGRPSGYAAIPTVSGEPAQTPPRRLESATTPSERSTDDIESQVRRGMQSAERRRLLRDEDKAAPVYRKALAYDDDDDDRDEPPHDDDDDPRAAALKVPPLSPVNNNKPRLASGVSATDDGTRWPGQKRLEVRLVAAVLDDDDDAEPGKNNGNDAPPACSVGDTASASSFLPRRGLVFESDARCVVDARDAVVRFSLRGVKTATADASSAPRDGATRWLDLRDELTERRRGRVALATTTPHPVVVPSQSRRSRRRRRDDEEDEAVEMTDRLFEELWGHNKGTTTTNAHRVLLTRSDVLLLVRALLAVGGNVKTLAGKRRKRGVLARCVQIPEEDLFAYVLHRHCCLRVCYGAVGLAAKSTWQSRLALVGVSLLWSLSANCLVSAIIMRDQSRLTQVVVITVADSTGVTVLSTVFYLAHVPIVTRLLRASSLNLPAILTTAFCFVTLILLLVSLTPDELYLAVYSFLPIWCTARVYELFEKGTLWALQVQLGSYPKQQKLLPGTGLLPEAVTLDDDDDTHSDYLERGACGSKEKSANAASSRRGARDAAGGHRGGRGGQQQQPPPERARSASASGTTATAALASSSSSSRRKDTSASRSAAARGTPVVVAADKQATAKRASSPPPIMARQHGGHVASHRATQQSVGGPPPLQQPENPVPAAVPPTTETTAPTLARPTSTPDLVRHESLFERDATDEETRLLPTATSDPAVATMASSEAGQQRVSSQRESAAGGTTHVLQVDTQ